MKYLRLIAVLVMLLAVSVQCTDKSPLAKIRKLEDKISSENFTFDQQGMQVAEDLILAYIQFAEENKDANETPEYLYKSAELSLNLGKTQQALELYNRIIYQYPNFKKAPECLFLLAFIYENNLQNFGKAKELYESFIAKYPDHEFADDAAVSIQNMGKSPEELIREFEAKAKLSDTAV